MKKKKSLTAKNKELRERIRELEINLNEIEADREKYRSHFKKRLKWFLQLLGEGKSPSMTWIVEDEAKFWNNVKPFWWG